MAAPSGSDGSTIPLDKEAYPDEFRTETFRVSGAVAQRGILFVADRDYVIDKFWTRHGTDDGTGDNTIHLAKASDGDAITTNTDMSDEINTYENANEYQEADIVGEENLLEAGQALLWECAQAPSGLADLVIGVRFRTRKI